MPSDFEQAKSLSNAASKAASVVEQNRAIRQSLSAGGIIFELRIFDEVSGNLKFSMVCTPSERDQVDNTLRSRLTSIIQAKLDEIDVFRAQISAAIQA
jgi:hypothetical protein